jgi:DNA polymerase III sliding clamp (beta) subunit (PCNA family)
LKISFSKEDFVNAIKWTTDIIETNDDVATVRMETSDDGSVTFASISGEGERTISVQADIAEGLDDSLELVASALKKVPSQITSDTVVLTYSSKDRTQVLVDVGLKLKLPIMSSQNLPVHGTDNMTHVGVLSPADLFYVAGKLSAVSDTSVADSRFSCLYFETQDDDHIKAVATDGFVLTTRLLAYSPDSKDKQLFLLPSTDIKKMSDASSATSVDLYVDDVAIVFSFDDGRVARVNKFRSAFMEYGALVFGDRDGESNFDVSLQDLKSAVTKLGSWATSDEDNNVYLDVAADTNDITIHNSSNTWNTVIKFVGTLDEDYHAVFRFSTLSRTLNATDADTIRYRFIKKPEDDISYAVIWDQIRNDGTVDDLTYILSLPITPSHL